MDPCKHENIEFDIEHGEKRCVKCGFVLNESSRNIEMYKLYELIHGRLPENMQRREFS